MSRFFGAIAAQKKCGLEAAIGDRPPINIPPVPKKHDAQNEGLGRSRGGISAKVHLGVNGLGLPVAMVLTGRQVFDIKGYGPAMTEPGPEPKVIIADKGYDADAILGDL